MFHARAFVLSLLLISGLNLAAKDKNKDKESPVGWLPITQQDFSINEVPNDPGRGCYSALHELLQRR
jgi:hypothetical protein